MSDYLPEEVITNILLRLPIKSLVICTSVCKSWRSMIKDSSFIGAHLSRTIELNNHHGTHLLLLHRFSSINSSVPWIKEDVYSLHYDNSGFEDCCEIGFQNPIADGEMHNESFRVVGVHNGLVCLADDLCCYGYNFLIWNPFIRKLVTLPKPGLRFETVGGYDAYHGFAFDAVTNDYMVVRLVKVLDGWGIEEGEDRTFVEVYSLAAGSWSNPRLVDPQCLLYGQRSPQAFVNGALHWVAVSLRSSSLRRLFILAYDVRSDLFWEIMLPKSLDWDSLRAGHLELRLSVSGDGKSLALFMRYRSYDNPSFLEVWVMKEYCVEESWTKLITLYPTLCPQGQGGSVPSALCFRKSGEIVLVRDHYYGGEEVKRELVSLDLVSRKFKNLGICRYEYYTIDPYEESLVLLDRNEAISC